MGILFETWYNIIIPIDMVSVETIMSMTRNGSAIRQPISNPRMAIVHDRELSARLAYCDTRRVRKLCLDGVNYGESRDVQARIFRTGGPPAGTVFNGST